MDGDTNSGGGEQWDVQRSFGKSEQHLGHGLQRS